MRTIESNEEELIVATKIPVGSLSGFFFGGISMLHGWSHDSEAFLYSDSESVSSEATIAIYDITKTTSTRIPATIINPSWHDSHVPSVVESNTYNYLPLSYRLEQNYPNPFNASTLFTLSLPIQEHVSIKVYDLTGQIVANIVDNVFNPGRYEIRWYGTRLASGTFFYQMNAGKVKLTRKMLLLR